MYFYVQDLECMYVCYVCMYVFMKALILLTNSVERQYHLTEYFEKICTACMYRMYVCMYVCMYVGDIAVLACVLVLPDLEDGVAVVRRPKHREGRALRR